MTILIVRPFTLCGKLLVSRPEELVMDLPGRDTRGAQSGELSGFKDRMETHAAQMRDAVRTETGIPTCVRIAPTKTLAKLANYAAKKNPIFSGVCNLMNEDVRD